jgi:hypothetical protein
VKQVDPKQGEFIRQLAQSKKTKKVQTRFDWRDNVSGKPVEQPAGGKLNGPAIKDSKNKLLDQIPKTHTGNTDMGEMRNDLVAQMNRHRKKSG